MIETNHEYNHPPSIHAWHEVISNSSEFTYGILSTIAALIIGQLLKYTLSHTRKCYRRFKNTKINTTEAPGIFRDGTDVHQWFTKFDKYTTSIGCTDKLKRAKKLVEY